MTETAFVDDNVVVAAFSILEPSVAVADEAVDGASPSESQDAQDGTDASDTDGSGFDTDGSGSASDADVDYQAKLDQALAQARDEARSTDRAIEAGEFSFTLTLAGRDDLVVGTTTNEACGAGETARVAFPALHFTTEYVEGSLSSLPWLVEQGLATVGVDGEGHPTYTVAYTASEDTDSLPQSVTANVASFAVSVTLADDLKGNLNAYVTYPDGGMAFENSYDSAVVRVQGTKVLQGAPLSAGEFSFSLSAVDGGPLPTKDHASNDASGTVDFGEILFDEESAGLDKGSSHTFTYQVVEDATDVPGVVVDGEAKYFTVTVTRAEDGTFSATCGPASGALFTFTNVYVPTPIDDTVISQLSLTKSLVGRDLVEGEFSFAMYELDAGGSRVSDEPVATGVNSADGTIALSAVSFARSGVYRYEIVEVAGDEAGVAYDAHAVRVTATVADDFAAATLTVTWAVEEGSSLEFVNTYTPAPVGVSIVLTKELTGAELKEGQFAFTLTPEGGDSMTARNAADGTVAFPELTFTQAGTYTYTVVEVNDGQEGVTYDADAERTVVVEVTDDGQGQLHAGVSGDSLAFTNSYSEPKPDPEPTPDPEPDPEPTPTPDPEPTPAPTPADGQVAKTGDGTPDAAALAGCALAGISLTAAGAYTLRRRRDA